MNKKTLWALQNFVNGWAHFCGCINFGASALDADAIRWMNEVPGQIETALKEAKARKEPK